MSDPRARARDLRDRSLERRDPTGWFEALYSEAGADATQVPWADLGPNPHLVAWCQREGIRGAGRAVKVGCGWGDDAEFLAAQGFDVVAFDVAPSAVARCRARFPGSPVDYRVADLLALPEALRRSFDVVVEAYTLQVLPPELHPRAIEATAELVAPGGTLVVICRGREPEDPCPGLHWPLTRAELEGFIAAGLREVQLEDFLDAEEPPVRRFRATYRR
ncbi:MAG: class I SAM-dependent methyltransferase [Planctomycetota bacterium]